MSSPFSTRRIPLPLLGLPVGLLLSLTVQAASDTDYLLRIQEEAKRQAATPIATQTPPAEGVANLDTIERLPLGLQQPEFEKALQDQFIGTYVFYQRLAAPYKRQIFEAYQRDNRVSTIREQTLRFLAEGGTP